MLETKDTSASVLQKKRSSQKFFRQSPQKKVSQKSFQALHKILTIQKIVLSSSRGQANFRGLDLRGQGLQNMSSRTPPLIMNAILKFYALVADVDYVQKSGIVVMKHGHNP